MGEFLRVISFQTYFQIQSHTGVLNKLQIEIKALGPIIRDLNVFRTWFLFFIKLIKNQKSCFKTSLVLMSQKPSLIWL